MHKDNVLVIGDTHIPFEKKHYLDFCLEIQRRCHCGTVVHIGDLCDLHSCSYHEHCPDGYSPADEMKKADKVLAKWFKAFPDVFLCRGNHDQLISRKGKTAELPSRVFKEYRDIWRLPDGWQDDFNWKIYDVVYEHGTGFSGDLAHIKAAQANRLSTVIGHTHSALAGGYLVSEKDRIFGMNVGSGLDRHAYAFDYGRDFPKKPVIGCGVTTDRGTYWQVFPMKI